MNIFDFKKIENFFKDYNLNELEDNERVIEISEEINNKYSTAELEVVKNIVALESHTSYHQQGIAMGMWAAILALLAIFASVYVQSKIGELGVILLVIIYSAIIYLFYKKINNEIQKIKKISILINVAERHKEN